MNYLVFVVVYGAIYKKRWWPRWSARTEHIRWRSRQWPMQAANLLTVPFRNETRSCFDDLPESDGGDAKKQIINKGWSLWMLEIWRANSLDCGYMNQEQLISPFAQVPDRMHTWRRCCWRFSTDCVRSDFLDYERKSLHCQLSIIDQRGSILPVIVWLVGLSVVWTVVGSESSRFESTLIREDQYTLLDVQIHLLSQFLDVHTSAQLTCFTAWFNRQLKFFSPIDDIVGDRHIHRVGV